MYSPCSRRHFNPSHQPRCSLFLASLLGLNCLLLPYGTVQLCHYYPTTAGQASARSSTILVWCLASGAQTGTVIRCQSVIIGLASSVCRASATVQYMIYSSSSVLSLFQPCFPTGCLSTFSQSVPLHLSSLRPFGFCGLDTHRVPRFKLTECVAIAVIVCLSSHAGIIRILPWCFCVGDDVVMGPYLAVPGSSCHFHL